MKGFMKIDGSLPKKLDKKLLGSKEEEGKENLKSLAKKIEKAKKKS